MQTDNHNFRKNVTANEKYIVEKNEFKVSNNSTLYMFYYKTWTLLKLRGYGDKWDRSETSSIGWIRLLALISSETKTIHKIISRNSTLSIPIEIYLEGSIFYWWHITFNYWLICKIKTLSQNVPGMYDMPDLFFFFSTDHNIWCHFILWWLL